MNLYRRFVILTCFCMALHGCASYNPQPLREALFLKRAQTQKDTHVRVTAAVPSAQETRQVFGVDLYAKGIQPVWIEIENRNEKPIWFLPFSMDPLYYTPLEAAFLSHFRFSAAVNERMDRFFFDQGKDIYIDPGSTRSGFIFTNLDEGTKAFLVDLVGEDQQVRSFSFYIPVPGLQIDHREIDFAGLYPDDQWEQLEKEEAFIDYLENLPCCAADSKGQKAGDPLNLVVIGNGDDVYQAFMRAGWDETEMVTTASTWKTAMSYLFGGRYRYSPVSSLYLFERRQDAALQKARERIHERNHLRLWLAPVRFRDKFVFVGQISRDIGVRFNARTILTHKIDPDVDETRSYLIQDLWYSQGLSQFAFVHGVDAAPIDAPRYNLTGDPYFTDGLRAVLWVSSEPMDFQEVRFIEWALPPGLIDP